MPSNAAPYLQPIAEWESYPSFDDVCILVREHAPHQTVTSFVLQSAMEGLLLVGLMIVVCWHAISPTQQVLPSHHDDLPHKSATVTPVQTSSHKDHYASNATNVLIPLTRRLSQQHSGAQNTIDTPQMESVRTTVLELNTSDATPAVERPRSISRIISQKPIEASRWSGFASSGSSLKAWQVNAALGLRYQMSDNVWAIVELRRSTFSRASTDRLSYRDTTVYINGQPYMNTFTTSATGQRVLQYPITLGAGMRYEFAAEDMLSPFGELSIGGNTSLVLTSLNAGLRIHYSDEVSFDIAMRADRFVVRTLSPVDLLTGEITISYRW